jgi:hypothetical protein
MQVQEKCWQAFPDIKSLLSDLEEERYKLKVNFNFFVAA